MHTLKRLAKLAATELSEGKIRMVASTTGNPDRIGDVIMPGAFTKKAMAGMVKNGWLDVAHNWSGEPVGMIDSVTVQGNELIIEATWHNTEDALAQRQIVSERLAAGKKVSVSIGFKPDYENDGVKYFEKGADLLKWAADEGYDMTLLDSAAIKKRSWCRAIKSIDELFEVSICNVGMNPRAEATESKEFDPDDFSTDEGEETEAPAAKASLRNDLAKALAAIERAKAANELRAKDGRKLGSESLEAITAINKATADLLEHVAKLAPKEEAEPKSDDSTDLANEVLKLESFALTL